MSALRLLSVLALCLALLFVVLHPLRLTHPPAAFRNALCLCPLCVVTDGLLEASYGEYC